MWRDFLDHRLNLKWMSTNYKRALLLNPNYSSVNEIWGRARMAAILKQMQKRGEKVTSLGGGVTEIVEEGTLRWADPPDWIVEEVCEGAKTYRGYGKKQAEVKRLIAEWYNKDYGLDIDSDSEVLLCVGASFPTDACARLIAGPGDEVLIMDPDYVTYLPQVASTGARTVSVPLKEEEGEWHFDINELEKRANPMVKLLMMSNANNPSGFLYTEEDLEGIAELAKKYDFMVFHDQVAEEFILDRDEGYKQSCIASLPGMKERTIIGSSFSKMYNLVAFRTGWLVANKDFCENAHWFLVWVADVLMKSGIDASYAILREENQKEREKWIDKKLSDLKKQRDHMKKRLGEIEGVVPNTCRGHYWAWPNVSAFGMTSQELAEYLLKEAKVYVRPGTWYGTNGEGHFRLNFSVPMDHIDEAMDKMQTGLSKLPVKT